MQFYLNLPVLNGTKMNDYYAKYVGCGEKACQACQACQALLVTHERANNKQTNKCCVHVGRRNGRRSCASASRACDQQKQLQRHAWLSSASAARVMNFKWHFFLAVDCCCCCCFCCCKGTPRLFQFLPGDDMAWCRQPDSLACGCNAYW